MWNESLVISVEEIFKYVHYLNSAEWTNISNISNIYQIYHLLPQYCRQRTWSQLLGRANISNIYEIYPNYLNIADNGHNHNFWGEQKYQIYMKYILIILILQTTDIITTSGASKYIGLTGTTSQDIQVPISEDWLRRITWVLCWYNSDTSYFNQGWWIWIILIKLNWNNISAWTYFYRSLPLHSLEVTISMA